MPNWSLPWQRLKQEQSTSTGFVIDGRRIITNAHAVEYSTMIQVKATLQERVGLIAPGNFFLINILVSIGAILMSRNGGPRSWF